MPLNAIVHQIVALNPNRLEDGGPDESPESPNNTESSRDTVGKNTLLPINRSPSSTTPRDVSKSLDDLHN